MNKTNYDLKDSNEFEEEWLSAYLDGELTSEQRTIVESRLQFDSNAQQTLLDLQRVRRILSQLQTWPETDGESSLVNRLNLAELPPPKAVDLGISVRSDASNESTSDDSGVDDSDVDDADEGIETGEALILEESVGNEPSSKDLTAPSAAGPVEQERNTETETRVVESSTSGLPPRPGANGGPGEEPAEGPAVEHGGEDGADSDIEIEAQEDTAYEDETYEDEFADEQSLPAETYGADAGASDSSEFGAVDELDEKIAQFDEDEELQAASLAGELSDASEPAESKLSSRSWEEDENLSLFGLLRPLVLVASILIMTGIGWVLWQNTGVFLASKNSVPDTELAAESVTRSPPSDPAMEKASEEEELAAFALPEPSVNAVPAVPDSAALRSQMPAGNSGTASEGMLDAVPPQIAAVTPATEATPAPTYEPNLPLPSAPRTAATADDAGRADNSLEFSDAGARAMQLPEPAPGAPKSIEPAILSLGLQMQSSELESGPAMQVLGLAYSDAWSRAEIDAYMSSFQSGRRGRPADTVERIVGSAPAEQFLTAPAERLSRQASYLRYEALSAVPSPGAETLADEQSLTRTSAQSILLFVSRQQAEEVLQKLNMRSQLSQATKEKRSEQSLDEDGEEAPEIYRNAPRIVDANAISREPQPTDLVILQLNLQQ